MFYNQILSFKNQSLSFKNQSLNLQKADLKREFWCNVKWKEIKLSNLSNRIEVPMSCYRLRIKLIRLINQLMQVIDQKCMQFLYQINRQKMKCYISKKYISNARKFMHPKTICQWIYQCFWFPESNDVRSSSKS